ncbi:MAG: type II toxin-antitoxin system VapC family toxin [Terracidiphilus sp.]
MIVDSSALIAILLGEPEGRLFDVAILHSADCRMSAGNYLEASMVVFSRRGADGVRDLDLLVVRFGIRVVPFIEPQARLARQAFERFGKGMHPAGLNFGDCIAYALARETGEELLCKGNDFAQTDIAVARY